MATKLEIIKQLKAENPKVYHNTNDVQTEVVGAEYDSLIESWADFKIAKTAHDKKTLDAKSALLQKLGITAEEAALLLS
jgi:hypothetical protein